MDGEVIFQAVERFSKILKEICELDSIWHGIWECNLNVNMLQNVECIIGAFSVNAKYLV